MATQLFSNNAVSLLAAPIGTSDTMLTVMAGHGALFPQPANDGSDYFLITLEDQTASQREIIRVRARYGDTFTDIVRAQEGTTPHNWYASAGNDTLIDHRITAETMRLAMQLPLPPVTPSGIPGVTLQDEGVALPSHTTTLNFTGAGVSVTGTGLTKTINIPGGGSSGTAWINGASVGPTDIDPAWTIPISEVAYSQFNRGFKFFVTVVMPSNGRSETLEVLTTVTGDISANAETAEWTVYGRIGQRFLGGVGCTLDAATNTLQLTWTNNEAALVQAMTTRIQHAI